MSVSPLPIHISCFGVSSDAVNMARGYSKQSYSDRLATVKTSLAGPSPEAGSSSSCIKATGTGAGVQRSAGTTSPSRQSPQVKLQPLGTDQAQQALASGSCTGGSSSAPSSAPNSQLYRAHTKHIKTVTPTLQAVDFISIAVNSVGGGGVPRPYGKFQACRNGDGNATWERLPPSPGSWQARALPIAVTLLGDSPPASAPQPRPGSPTSNEPLRSQRSVGSVRSRGSTRVAETPDTSPAATSPRLRRPPFGSAPAATSDGTFRPSRVAGDVTRLRLSYTQPETGSGGGGPLSDPQSGAYRRSRSRSQPSPSGPSPQPNGSTAHSAQVHGQAGGPGKAGAAAAAGGGSAGLLKSGLHEQSYYRRPGSSMHRSLVTLPPPEPHNLAAWFALPAATFLAGVPDVPEQLRMDNGYSVSREFLMSGLNPPRRPPPPSPPRSPTHSHSNLAPQASYSQPGPNQPPLQPPPQPFEGDGGGGYYQQPDQQPRTWPEDSLALWNMQEAAAAAAAAAAVAATQQQQHGAAGGAVRLRGVYVPLERRPAEAELTAAGTPLLTASRGALRLPPEGTLPRRNEPAGW